MGVRRTHLEFEGQFTQVPNAWARDERLSRKARGLLVEIMSHRVGWHVSVSGLQKVGIEGRDAIKSALVELKDAGYLQVSQSRGDHGRFGEVEYELHDPATGDGLSVHGGSAADGSTADGSTASGQPTTKNTSSSEDQLSEDDLLLSPDESVDGELIPDDWRPNQTHIDKAASLHLDVRREYQRFREHAVRKHRRLKNWNAGFTNWLRKQAEYQQERQGTRPGGATSYEQGAEVHDILAARERRAVTA